MLIACWDVIIFILDYMAPFSCISLIVHLDIQVVYGKNVKKGNRSAWSIWGHESYNYFLVFYIMVKSQGPIFFLLYHLTFCEVPISGIVQLVKYIVFIRRCWSIPYCLNISHWLHGQYVFFADGLGYVSDACSMFFKIGRVEMSFLIEMSQFHLGRFYRCLGRTFGWGYTFFFNLCVW